MVNNLEQGFFGIGIQNGKTVFLIVLLLKNKN